MSQSGTNYKSATPTGRTNSGESQRLLGDRIHPSNNGAVVVRTNNGKLIKLNYFCIGSGSYVKIQNYELQHVYIAFFNASTQSKVGMCLRIPNWLFHIVRCFIYLIGLNCPHRLGSICDS